MKKHSKKTNKYFTLLSALLLAMLISVVSYASSGKDTNDVGFHVSAHIPDNQINTSLSYFDLHMEPSQEQSLAVSIVNTGSKQITVEVSAISASTNQNGIIDYRTRDIRDKTLRYPFSELAEVDNPTITIPAHEIKTAYINLTMPDEEYDGVILGGIVLAQKTDMDDYKNSSSQGGSAIINQYAYIVGVKLSETDIIVPPAFELENVAVDTVDYRPALVHYLRNTEAAIVKDMDVSVNITGPDSDKLFFEDHWVIDMAPNSLIHLPAFIDNLALKPGTYNSQMILKTVGVDTILNYNFTISRDQVRLVNNSIIKEPDSSHFWIWIIVLLLIIIVILFILLIILFKRRQDDDDENQHQPHHGAV